mmetsp:Transcript_12325/g.35618  ORF Transcript_12325/g.35618 Transcript_12325/m.35618 type:complete len:91 (+) Transcript_12325:925-1197(+)
MWNATMSECKRRDLWNLAASGVCLKVNGLSHVACASRNPIKIQRGDGHGERWKRRGTKRVKSPPPPLLLLNLNLMIQMMEMNDGGGGDGR